MLKILTKLEAMFPLFFGIIIVFIIITAFRGRKKEKEAFRKLASYLPGHTPGFAIAGSSLAGDYQGFKFSISLTSGGEDSPPYLVISLYKDSLFKLKIRRESFLGVIGKKMGLVHEVKINDEGFDRDFLMFSNSPNRAANYLNNPSIRNAIRELFERGFVVLSVDGRKASISKPYYNLESEFEPSKIMHVLQRLGFITRGL